MVPDAPINLGNLVAITLDDRIGLSWDDGLSNGGTSIIDYQVYFDDGLGTGVFIELASALTERKYTASGLYSGLLYTFRIKARNSVGYSDLSAHITILAAQVPDIPLQPTTEISDKFNVKILWSAPYSGGTSITGYKILIRTADVSVYALIEECNGFDLTILANTQCTVAITTLKA